MDFHVQRGEPIRAELWNALVDALGHAQIFPGKGIRRRVFDGRTILSADRVPRTGNSDTPYILGSTKYGSSMSGPHAHDDPPKWGGFDDVPTSQNDAFFDLTTPRLDEWHRSRRPLAPGASASSDQLTDSVILDLTRTHVVPADHSGFYWSDFDPVVYLASSGSTGLGAYDSGYVSPWGSFTRYTFKRAALFDSRNLLVSIAAEQLMDIAVVDYGSGSDGFLAAWGGLLV
jgi:hypothetical protein